LRFEYKWVVANFVSPLSTDPKQWGEVMAQEGFKRKLTAILSADVEGYSRLMGC